MTEDKFTYRAFGHEDLMKLNEILKEKEEERQVICESIPITLVGHDKFGNPTEVTIFVDHEGYDQIMGMNLPIKKEEKKND
jgi:hypothetical protein